MGPIEGGVLKLDGAAAGLAAHFPAAAAAAAHAALDLAAAEGAADDTGGLSAAAGVGGGGGASGASGASGAGPSYPGMPGMSGVPSSPSGPLLLQLAQDQSWMPSIDLYEGPKFYDIVMDVPGIGADGLRLSRSGTHTHVLAGRTTPYSDGAEVVRAGRRYGSFQLLLRVPDAYQCRWSACNVQNGVLRIRYPRDDDEEDVEVE